MNFLLGMTDSIGVGVSLAFGCLQIAYAANRVGGVVGMALGGGMGGMGGMDV
jgi:hypothetical protein